MNNRDDRRSSPTSIVAQTYARYPDRAWCAARARGCGTPTARSISTSSPASRSTASATAIRRWCAPSSSRRRKLLHVSNLYHIQPQAELARELCRHSFADRVFFCNSGAEANEAAIKLARRYGGEHLGGKYEILTAHNSFHGRTLATLTATGQEKVRRGFRSAAGGIPPVPFNDLGAAEAAIDANQDGRRSWSSRSRAKAASTSPTQSYLRGLRELCDRRGLLLIFDEVQTGMGRTGKLFGYEHFGMQPDIMTLAKALGGGLPFGAMLAREEVAEELRAGQPCFDLRRQPAGLQRRLGGDEDAAQRRRAQELRQDGQVICARSWSAQEAVFLCPRRSRQRVDPRPRARNRGAKIVEAHGRGTADQLHGL